MTSVKPVSFLVFSIRDTKTNVYHSPFYQQSIAGAVRAFSDLATAPDSTISKHPDDFQLFEIGTFDSESGELTPKQPVYLASATDFKN